MLSPMVRDVQARGVVQGVVPGREVQYNVEKKVERESHDRGCAGPGGGAGRGARA